MASVIGIVVDILRHSPRSWPTVLNILQVFQLTICLHTRSFSQLSPEIVFMQLEGTPPLISGSLRPSSSVVRKNIQSVVNDSQSLQTPGPLARLIWQ